MKISKRIAVLEEMALIKCVQPHPKLREYMRGNQPEDDQIGCLFKNYLKNVKLFLRKKGRSIESGSKALEQVIQALPNPFQDAVRKILIESIRGTDENSQQSRNA